MGQSLFPHTPVQWLCGLTMWDTSHLVFTIFLHKHNLTKLLTRRKQPHGVELLGPTWATLY